MNSPAVFDHPTAWIQEEEPSRSRRRNRLLKFIVLTLLGIAAVPFLLVAAVGLYVLSCLHLSSTTNDLKSVVLQHSGGGWRWQGAGRVGSIPLTLARLTTQFVPDVPPEARLALSAARSGEVAVYHRSGNPRKGNFPALMVDADRVMHARGWERFIGVVDGDQCVGMYAPSGQTSESHTEATLFMVTKGELVVASATTDLRPLVQLVRSQLDKEGQLPPRNQHP